jgi:hypothetical protein
MTLIWIFLAASVGFVLGAAWCALGQKNKQVDIFLSERFTK